MWEQLLQKLQLLPALPWNFLLAGCAVLIGFFFKWLLSSILHYQIKHKRDFSIFRSFILRLGKPLSFLLPLVALNIMLPLMKLGAQSYIILDKLFSILLIISVAGILVAIVKVCEDYVINTYDLKKENNLRERKIRTQLQFIRKLVIALIMILTVCAILLTFDTLRRVGQGLLTGVGVSGIIVGFAAQRSLTNLLAGFQIAFTQPIRIEDVLVVEGEWGRVEEITLTYVVLNIWDERRLILPINYFIEKPFQNWTRTNSEILGTAFIYLDYTAPVDEIRKEFFRLLSSNELWDKRVKALQVTSTTENVIEIRALMSASSSSRAFDLRCFIRENLIAFIHKHHSYCLPKTRAEVQKGDVESKIQWDPVS
jgi:small-conductance mechanosensitive channel